MNKSVLVGWPRRLRVALSVLLVAVVAGCGGDGDEPAPVAEASATIGAAGGTLTGPDGFQITVPPGALSQPTTIRIARTGVGAPQAAPDGFTPGGPVYEVTPHGLGFNLPVTISMPAAPVPGSEVISPFTAGPNEGWRALPATVVDGRATWETMSFSWFMVGICLPNSADPYTCVRPRMAPQLTATPAAAVTQFLDGDYVKAWRVTQAASLRMALSVSAAADCLRAARVRVRPRLPLIPGHAPDFGEPVFDQDVVMLPDPTNPKRARQTVNWDFSLSSADNGTKSFWVQFSCERLYNGWRQSIDGQAVFVVDAPPTSPLPEFTAQPVDASVVAPETATFSVAAAGVPTPSVQWQRSNDGGANWANVAGATAASYTTPATTLTDDGSLYRAVASNAGGTITSTAARLSVAAPLLRSWQAPKVVAASAGNFQPTVGFDANRRALAVWHALPIGGNATRTYFASGSAAGGWSAPQLIDGAFTNGSEARIAVAPDGRAVAVWSYKTGNQYHLAASHFDGSAWAAPVRVDTGTAHNASGHKLAIDANGRAVVTWEQYDGTRYGVYGSIHAGAGWSAPVSVDRGLDSGVTSLALNAQGQGFVLFGESADTVVATPIDLATGFGAPQVLRAKGRPTGPSRIAVDDSGAAMAVWIDGTLDGDKLRYSRYAATAGWSAPADVASDVGFPFDRDLALAGAGSGTVIVAWSQRDAEADEVVLSRRFTPGGGWEAVERLSLATPERDYAITPRVAINVAGSAVVTWFQYDRPTGLYQVWGKVYNGGWRSAQRLGTPANQADTRDYEHGLAIGADSGVVSLWVEVPEVGTDKPLVSAFWD